jgi:transcription termination/antitermination protein NusA
VFTYNRLGRAVVLVEDDQLSLAIGRRGQNVRLASKLVGWDIEIMTHEELAEGLERAERWFGQLPHVNEEMIQTLIGEGFLSYNDLTFMDAPEMAIITGLPEEQADEVVMYAEEYSDTMEQSVEQERREIAEQQAAAQAEMEAAAQAALDADAAALAAEAAANPEVETVSVPEENSGTEDEAVKTEDTPVAETKESPV